MSNNKIAGIKQQYDEDKYTKGLNDAWDAAKKIVSSDGFSRSELTEIFGDDFYTGSIEEIFNKLSISDVIKKIKEHEKGIEIEVEVFTIGDELEQITNSGIETGLKCVITKIGKDDFYGIDPNGRAVVCSSQIHRWWKKTGRHFDQVEDLLNCYKKVSLL